MTSSLVRPRRVVAGVWAGTVAVATGRLIREYRRDIAAAEVRLDAVPRMTVETKYGVVEYAESGTGAPLLVSHGIFHGCDGGLTSVRDTVIGRRVISPSRFGYLGSTLPAAATAADQADAFVALLDHLGVDQVDVVGISAGATGALHMALRHPDRVRHLVVLSGNLPGDPNAVAPPGWARLFYNDVVMWGMKRFAHAQAAQLMGIPAGLPRDEAQTRFVDEMLDSILPMAPRFAGGVFDAYESNPSVNDFPLERLSVPTLLVHTKDDPPCAFSAAEQAAAWISGCQFVALDSGGHLGLGQDERTRTELEAFLKVPVPV